MVTVYEGYNFVLQLMVKWIFHFHYAYKLYTVLLIGYIINTHWRI